MGHRFKRIGVAGLAIGLALAFTSTGARAEDRSVTIIEGAPEPTEPEAPPVVPPIPSTPGVMLRTTNPAGVHVDLVPGADLPVGTDVVFKVATEKPGYLILVDINADKQATQIYPNVMSLAQTQAKKAGTNLLKPGTPVEIPDAKNPLARFVFRTEPPLGSGVIIAILSDQPVQLIDLPELPPDLPSSQAYVDAIDQSLRKLLVAQAGKPGKFDQGTWSLSAVEYSIK